MTTVLYIAGWGRSGTTLLDNLLGQVQGVAATGELHNLWQRGIIEGRDCGCGVPVPQCPFWREVLGHGAQALDPSRARAAIASQDRIHTRHVGTVLRALRAGTVPTSIPYAAHLAPLYDAIAEVSGAQVIVDSSKFPVDALVAAGLPGVDVHVVHLVRDPRAVAYSWSRRKPVRDKTSEGGMLRRVGLVRSTLVWQEYNAVISVLVRRAVGPGRYLRVDYEELAREPAQVMERILSWVGVDPSGAPTVSDGRVAMSPTHSAGGNPDRFRSGTTVIRPDRAWRTEQPRGQRLAAAALAVPTWWWLRADRTGRRPRA